MAVRENEAISFRVLRTRNAQHFSIKQPDDVSHGQRRADVAHVRPPRLIQNNPPYLGARNLDFRGRWLHFHNSNDGSFTWSQTDCKGCPSDAESTGTPGVVRTRSTGS